MQEYKTEEVRVGFSELLDATQWRGEHAAISHYRRRVAVFVDAAWYDRATQAVGQVPEVVEAPRLFAEARAKLAELVRYVAKGAHVRFTRHGQPAAVLVPVDWYERAQQVLLAGPEQAGPSDAGG